MGRPAICAGALRQRFGRARDPSGRPCWSTLRVRRLSLIGKSHAGDSQRPRVGLEIKDAAKAVTPDLLTGWRFRHAPTIVMPVATASIACARFVDERE